MIKSLINLYIVCCFAFVSISAFAKNLTAYRQQLGSDQSKAISDRRAELDKILGMDGFGLAARIANDKIISEIRNGGGSSRSKEYTGTALKLRFDEVSRKLRDLERYDPPLQFDPGKVPSALREAAANRRREFCQKYFDAKIPGESRSNLELAASEYLTAMNPSTKAKSETRISQQQLSSLTSTVSSHLNFLASKGINLSQLGTLESVEVNDGVINRLNFRIGSNSIPISLSTLVTSRTGIESAFMTLFGYFGERINQAIAENKTIPSLAIYRAIHPRLVEDSKTALRVHQAVESMHSKSKNVLISLMIQFQGEDLPVDGDFDNNQSIETAAGSFAALVQNETLGLTSTKTLSRLDYDRQTSAASELLADYRFYRLMNMQLFEVAEIVREENERFAAIETIKQRM